MDSIEPDIHTEGDAYVEYRLQKGDYEDIVGCTSTELGDYPR